MSAYHPIFLAAYNSGGVILFAGTSESGFRIKMLGFCGMLRFKERCSGMKRRRNRE